MVVVLGLTLNCCDSRRLMNRIEYESHFNLYIFKFNDDSYKDYVILSRPNIDYLEGVSPVNAFTRRDVNYKYFGFEQECYDIRNSNFFDADKAAKYQYDKCDLSEGPHLIELHKGYYIWYPFSLITLCNANRDYVNGTSKNGFRVYNIKWQDLCDRDLEEMEVLSEKPFGEVLQLYAYDYANDMSIEELVEFINQTIDNDMVVENGPKRWVSWGSLP